ncbi:uncharacterized protein LOC128663451 isoform X2 [Bombina bombina]|uniref:uncharacterized protein LOC128663451 isoform X2 n=1 Tax=Bombina bombina TaxID=8345 RepID=UPI00235A8AC8|nr:uncharacterized protein LOC128663451 isoform X2 [Bombina bombina]
MMGRSNSTSDLTNSEDALIASVSDSFNRRRNSQISSSASYLHCSLARTLLLYFCIAVWLIVPVESSTTATSQSGTAELPNKTAEVLNSSSDPMEYCNQNYVVLSIKKSNDSHSGYCPFAPYLNPTANITFTNTYDHLTEDIACTFKKRKLKGYTYLIIDTAVHLKISGCTLWYSQIVTIHDSASKWFMTWQDNIFAISLNNYESTNKDQYIMSIYSLNGNLLCTFKKVGTNKYIVYENGQIKLKGINMEDSKVQSI